MAFADPLALKNAAAAAVSLTRRGPIPNGNRYVDTAATPAASFSTDIRSLLVTPKSGQKYTRNIVTFGITRTDVDDKQHVGSLSVSLVRPLATDITDTDINDLFAMWAEFLIASAGGYLAKFKRGET